MPPVVIGAIIAGGAGVVAAKISSNAASKAGQTAAAATTEALNYTEQKDAQDRADKITAQNASYAQQQAKDARLQPYLQAGAGASSQLRTGLGLPAVSIAPLPPAPVFKSTFDPQPTTPASAPAAPSGGMARLLTSAIAPQGQLVTMRAPDGSMNKVPASAVPYYTQKGAQVVNG